jgi:hypothetical protein
MKKMIKTFQLLFLFLLIFLIKPALANALTIDSIGGNDSIVGLGSTVKTYETTLTTFTVTGTASSSAEVQITLADLNNNTAADTEGNWGVNFSAVSYGENDLVVSSGGETLDLVINVAEVASISTPSADSTSSTETVLPESGALENTIIIFAFGILTLGLGLTLKSKN